jgi:RNA polymerase sigma-70 factor (ECF subfamily)
MADRRAELSRCADDELVVKAQQNDGEAFEELMRRTSASSLRLAMSILRDREEAEDEVQNSYLNAWRHVSQFHREAKFSTWMSRIVANHCLMRLRKARRARFVFLDDAGAEDGARPLEVADSAGTPEADLGGHEVSALVHKEIRRLPPLMKRVLVLREIEDLSTAEIAERLGITVSATKSRLLRARAELRNRMAKYCGDSGPATLMV